MRVRWDLLLGVGLLVTCRLAAGGDIELKKLVDGLRSSEPKRSAESAVALGQLGTKAKAAVPALIAALLDDRIARRPPFPVPVGYKTVANSAFDALVRIGSASVPELSKTIEQGKNSELRERCAEALMRMGKAAEKAAPVLERAVLRDSSYAVRFYAIAALQNIQLPPRRLVPLLIKTLDDKKPDVRGLAARTLGELGANAKDAVPALRRALNDKGYRSHWVSADFAMQRAVRYDVAEALGRIGAPARSSLEQLETMMTKDEGEVRVSAALAVCRIDPKRERALKVIVTSLQDDSEGTDVPSEAAYALQQLGKQAEPALDALHQVLKHKDVDLHWDAIQAIQAIGGKKAVQVLDSALLHQDADTRTHAAEALGQLGTISAAAVPKLIKLLMNDGSNSAYMRQVAARALGKIGPAARASLPLLRKARKDKDRYVREAATKAIERIHKDSQQ